MDKDTLLADYQKRQQNIVNNFSFQKDKALNRMIQIAHDIEELQQNSNQELAEINQKIQELNDSLPPTPSLQTSES